MLGTLGDETLPDAVWRQLLDFGLPEKMKLILSPTVLVVLALSGCDESTETATVAPEIAAEIERIQAENNYTDAQVTAALERWINIYDIAKELLESHEVFGSDTWTPERFAQLMAESEQALKEARHEDRMLAIYSLSHLRALNEGRHDEVARSLREIVASHFKLIKDNPDETREAFLDKVQALAETDPELGRLLAESESDPEPDAGTAPE